MSETVLQNLVVMLSSQAVSFCHYEVSAVDEPQLLGLELLAEAIAYARREGLALSFVYGALAPPSDMAVLIESIAHTKILPLALSRGNSNELVVINAQEARTRVAGGSVTYPNLILRLAPEDFEGLVDLLTGLEGRYRRLNLCLTGMESLTEELIDAFGAQLASYARDWPARLNTARPPEINVLTDRLMLEAMNNCEAGLCHLTLAPDGRFYLCPAFYGLGEAEALGDLAAGWQVRNGQLLDLEHAPICKRCDAFHCRRCVWLNRQLTDEVNIPSRQQCLAAHVEREASRLLCQAMEIAGLFGPGARPAMIERLSYRDPFEVLKKGTLPHRAPSRPVPDQLPAGDAPAVAPESTAGGSEKILLEILAVQREILEQLKWTNQILMRERKQDE